MQKSIDIRNTRTVRTEKTLCLALGMIVYFVSLIKDRFLSSADLRAAVAEAKEAKDKDTKLANFCAIGVAAAVSAVIYVTLLFFVGKGHTNGIAAELIISGAVFAAVYKIISFLETVE